MDQIQKDFKMFVVECTRQLFLCLDYMFFLCFKKKKKKRSSVVAQCLKLQGRGIGSIPGHGTKILHSTHCDLKKGGGESSKQNKMKILRRSESPMFNPSSVTYKLCDHFPSKIVRAPSFKLEI